MAAWDEVVRDAKRDRTETVVRVYRAGEVVRETTTVEYPAAEKAPAAPARSEISATAASTQVNTADPPFGFRVGRIERPVA